MSTITQPAHPAPSQRRGAVARFVVRHPIAAFLIGAYGVGGPLLTVYVTVSLPALVTTVVGLAFTYLGLLGSALAVTWVIGGRPAVLLPLQFAAGWTWASVALGVVALAVVAPFFRYLLGETLHATGGSLLAVGILHAAFNVSGQLGFPGGWQVLPALVVLALAVGLVRRFRPRFRRP